MTARAPQLSLADTTEVLFEQPFPVEAGGSRKKYTPNDALKSICAQPPHLGFLPLLDQEPTSIKAFVSEVTTFLNCGMPLHCVLLNPLGDGNCLL